MWDDVLDEEGLESDSEIEKATDDNDDDGVFYGITNLEGYPFAIALVHSTHSRQFSTRNANHGSGSST